MEAADLRHRDADGAPVAVSPNASDEVLPTPNVPKFSNSSKDGLGQEDHPSGKKSHGKKTQIFRGALFTIYFVTCVIVIFISQLIGAPLYLIDRQKYYAYMAFSKESFALVTVMMTQLWGPTLIRFSGDPDVTSQIRRNEDGTVEFSFPERMVLIANHQIYTDWLYLWWVGYANKPGMAGHLYIILKESLKWIPLLGQGMMFYGFIFMSRKMAVDQPRLAHRLNTLKTQRQTASGSTKLDPMWLLLFPEGTNLSDNGRVKSAQWAKKNGLRDPEHLMLPRSTGIFFCLNELKGTVDYVYDCTMAYEGVPRGGYGEEYFTLSSIYFQGRPPKSVNFYWRRFRIDDMPLHDQAEFDAWMRARWDEKDALMEQYMATGRFPSSEFSAEQEAVDPASAKKGFVETEVRTRWPWEFLQAFVVLGTVLYVLAVVSRVWTGLTETFFWWL
jgi:lysocardiolipin and lysophospholipid acyltransferase